MKIEFETIIFEIPILTVASMVSYMISTVKIGISNIIESQTLSLSCSGSFFRIPIYLFEINNFFKFTRVYISIYQVVCLICTLEARGLHIRQTTSTNSITIMCRGSSYWRALTSSSQKSYFLPHTEHPLHSLNPQSFGYVAALQAYHFVINT